ncbi:hypothetical protein GJ697_22410 [Pseudoduganella sp. FT25W]|jgi:hypothetical protein|uniref:Uncharacterized protein n=1 Tax=Duganella alba TaxID=2666081 RepID=A0A6L5QLJ3_9BURK|nr:hypothetical protein [Duganella alba]MRX10589.1 hypothetical protein [Duganella alba]MRX15792.1 hypothetical protein [Duganella alba]
MDTHTNNSKPRKYHPAAYAMHRQMVAVRRTISAPTVEESQAAARWAQAWYQLVQRKLDQLQHAPRYLH